jgi:hypothetical protein
MSPLPDDPDRDRCEVELTGGSSKARRVPIRVTAEERPDGTVVVILWNNGHPTGPFVFGAEDE